MKSSEGKYSELWIVVVSYTVIGVLILLILGGSIGLPVALSITVGGSMYPTVHSGDLAVLVSTSISKLSVGDIGVYKVGSMFVLHRVVKIENNTVIFEGDNNVFKDNPVSTKNVMYKAVAIIPYMIWVPVFTVIAVTFGILPQYYLFRKKKEPAYTLHTFMIFLLFMLMVSLFSSSIFVDRGYSVKPNPMPAIEKVTSAGNEGYYVYLNVHPSSVYCKGGLCSLVGYNKIYVKPAGDTVWVYLKLPTEYNLVVEFTLHFTGGGK
jgi:signal peptidase I